MINYKLVLNIYVSIKNVIFIYIYNLKSNYKKHLIVNQCTSYITSP